MNISDDKEIEEKVKQEEKINSLNHPTFYILFDTHTLHYITLPCCVVSMELYIYRDRDINIYIFNLIKKNHFVHEPFSVLILFSINKQYKNIHIKSIVGINFRAGHKMIITIIKPVQKQLLRCYKFWLLYSICLIELNYQNILQSLR